MTRTSRATALAGAALAALALSTGAVTAGLVVGFADGASLAVLWGADWRSSDQPADGWTQPDFDQAVSGVAFVGVDAGFAVFEVGAGRYRFET